MRTFSEHPRVVGLLRGAGLYLLALVAAAGAAAEGGEADGKVDFAREVRPLFSDRCFKCHGPEETGRQAGLRLDIKEGAFARRRAGGLPVVPGDPGASLIHQRITAADPADRMPPAESGKTLSAEEIALIGRWIQEGAEWSQHWAFEPIRRPRPPSVPERFLVQNTIDAFAIARLLRERLEPAPEADRVTLIRRVTFDLTGLPPTIEEIDAFLADASADAYDKVVERLLASPSYGEHMARYWLDAARYGDTHGLHLDNERSIWPYRDWVIRAFNDNLPFDRFTIEQLAGDLLPEPTVDQRIATGFNRCNVTTSEGGAIDEEFYVRYAVDRVETTATVWLGLTLGCAVCHDHKYDPFTQKEFYRLFAYFNSLTEKAMDGNALLPPPAIKAPSPMQRERLGEFQARIGALEKALSEREAAAAADLPRWEAELLAAAETQPVPPAGLAAHYPLDEADGDRVAEASGQGKPGKVVGRAAHAQGKFARALEFDGNAHVDCGDTAGFDRTDAFSAGAWILPASNAHMAVVARMDDGNAYRGWDLYLGDGKVYVHLIHRWDQDAIRVNTRSLSQIPIRRPEAERKAGRQGGPTQAIQAESTAEKDRRRLPGLQPAEARRGIEIASRQPVQVEQWQHVMMTYDGSGKAAGVKVYLDGRPQELEVTHDNLQGTLKTKKPLHIGRRSSAAPFTGKIDDVRIYSRALAAEEVALLAGSDPIRAIARIPSGERSADQEKLLRQHLLLSRDAEYGRIEGKLSEERRQLSEFEGSIPMTLVMEEAPQRREAFVLTRGDYEKKGEKVERGVPAVLPLLPEGAPDNRLGLARWLVDPSHPLTARVTVNRFWQRYFGTGLVKTSEDFGSQGEPPTHPGLLDWLAAEFIQSGWDIKHMQRLIVTSATYRQSSRVTPEKFQKDKENRLFSRGPRFRLDAEVIRDNALAVSGLLEREIGGKSVNPYQPPGIWEAVAYPTSNTARFKQDEGKALWRRSIYTFWKRTAPPANMQILDAPTREKCTVRRERTNTPVAALALMNDIQFVEAARHFAERVMREAGPRPEDRIERAFRLAVARRPAPEETAVVLEVLGAHLEKYREEPEAARALLSVGDSPRNEALDPVEHAAWTMVANMVLNLDETITKE